MQNTDSALTLAQSRLLLPAGLDAPQLDRMFGTLLGPGIDFGDLYFQHSRRESWSVEDGIVKDGAHSIEQGVGVRAISGEKTGFAYSDDLDAAALMASAQSARAIARDGREHGAQALQRHDGRRLYPALDPVDALGNDAKVAALRRVDALLRALDPRVQQVIVGLSGGVDTVLVARSDGVLAGDVRPLVRMNVQVIVEQDGRRESGYAGFGGRQSYDDLLADGKPEKFAREALRQALVNLEAIDAPAGVMPVVLGAGWPGVLLHEAVGHGLEGDFNRKGTSAFSGLIGQRVACAGNSYALHAEYNWVPRNLCVPLPKGVSGEHAAFTTVGAIAMQGYRQSEARLGETACVIGCAVQTGVGAVLNTVNPRLFDDQIVYVLEHAESTVLFYDATFAPLVERLASRFATVKTFVLMADADSYDAGAVDALNYETLIGGESDARFNWPRFDENAGAFLCYTSGTTGDPKGVMLTHHNMVSAAESPVVYYRYDRTPGAEGKLTRLFSGSGSNRQMFSSMVASIRPTS